MIRSWKFAFAAGLAGLLAASAAPAANVTTYHNDTLRTGWNPEETLLTPNLVKYGDFRGLIGIPLDEQADAQPLVVSGQPIQGQGTHDVVYVATEGDSLYAVDAHTDAFLISANFGRPVPQSALPGGCGNNSAHVGISGTPVIDTATGTLYMITYVYKHNVPTYLLHAVDISTLTDKMPPVRVAGSALLANGHKYRFNAAVSRQRAALLLANGNVYAAFASFCDMAADQSRGWVLGWQKDTLKPLAHNELTNVLTTSPDNFFLSSVWMSGYGLASQPSTGDIYFVTGNSDPTGTTLNPATNLAESAVQISADLSTVKSVFTPDNAVSLEQSDGDFGSGGFTLLPAQPNQTSNLGVAAGKDGTMYFLNADNLNNNATGVNRILGSYGIGGCWCGQSYFTAADGTGRLVTSGGSNVGIWKVMAGAQPRLVQIASTTGIGGNQDPGFFTSVSSNGNDESTAVIWAASRPDNSPQHDVRLYAFEGSKGRPLRNVFAGTWPNTGANANLVPTVANGRVFLATYKFLTMFGVSGTPAMPPPAVPFDPTASEIALAPGVHEIYARVRAIDGTMLEVTKRDGSTMAADGSIAQKMFRYAEPRIDDGVILRGSFGTNGVLNAEAVMRAKRDPAMWPADR